MSPFSCHSEIVSKHKDQALGKAYIAKIMGKNVVWKLYVKGKGDKVGFAFHPNVYLSPTIRFHPLIIAIVPISTMD